MVSVTNTSIVPSDPVCKPPSIPGEAVPIVPLEALPTAQEPLTPHKRWLCGAAPEARETVGQPLRSQKTFIKVRNKEIHVCNQSLFLFPIDGVIRRNVISLVTRPCFDRFILVLIVLNSVILAGYQHRQGNTSGFNWFADWVADPIFTAIFTLECCCKVIAWGFILDKNSYLRNGWNWIDFLVVVTGLTTYMPFNKWSETTGFLRMFRILRPLRSLHVLPQMEVLVNTLISSIPRLANVTLMSTFSFVVFSIVGLILLNGVFYHGCRRTEHPQLSLTADGSQCWLWEYTGDSRLCGGRYMCGDPEPGVERGYCGGRDDDPFEELRPKFPGGHRGFAWCEGSEPRKMLPEADFVHFDHIGGALLSVFQSMTLEGWSTIMYSVQDGCPYVISSTVFFIVLIPITAFGMVNVALAVVDETRKEVFKDDDAESETDNGGNDTGAEESDGNHSHSVLSSLTIEMLNEPSLNEEIWLDIPLVHSMRSLAFNPVFMNFIMFFIAANVVTMALDRHPPIMELQDFLEASEYIFLSIFSFEMLVMLGALGPKRYALNAVTLFDGIIVCASWIQVCIGSDKSGFAALRTLRLFRVLNKLANRWMGFRVLLKAIAQTAISLQIWLVLFTLFLYISTLAFMTLFARQFHFKDPDTLAEVSEDQGEPWCRDTPHPEDCIPRAHFDTFLWALITIFQIMTGENWNSIMYAGMRANGWIVSLCFVFLILFGQLLFLSLFLSMLMSKFDKVEDRIEADEIVKMQQQASRRALSEARRRRNSEELLMNVLRQFKKKKAFTKSKGQLTTEVTGSRGLDSGQVLAGPIIFEGERAISELERFERKAREARALMSVLRRFSTRPNQVRPDPEPEQHLMPVVPIMPLDVPDLTDQVPTLSEPLPGQILDSRCCSVLDSELSLSKTEVEGSGSLTWMSSAPNAPLPMSGVSRSFSGIERKSPRLHMVWDLTGQEDTIPLPPPAAPPVSTMTAKPRKWPRGYACFLLHESNRLRQLCQRILTVEVSAFGNSWKLFDSFILICILINTVCMALDGPLNDPKAVSTQVVRIGDIVFSIIFIVEMAVKMLALGVVWGDTAYLKSGWNWLDGIVVLVSVVDMTGASSAGVIKTLRIVRALRPLRVISRHESLKVVVRTIFDSLPDLGTLIIVALLFLLIFGLFAIDLFAGQFYTCSPGENSVAFLRDLGGNFRTPLWLGSDAYEATACPRGVFNTSTHSWQVVAEADCPYAGNDTMLSWQRASADTPICIGRCDPFEHEEQQPPEALCPRRLTRTEELASACSDRDTDAYQRRIEERWGPDYVADEARGAEYVAKMQRVRVMPCGGSSVDEASGHLALTASAVSCRATFCPTEVSADKVGTCRSNCRKHKHFCKDSCSADEQSAACQSCRLECEAACQCSGFCEPLIKDAALCWEQGGNWHQGLSQNFDNIWNSLLTLFEISSTEGWVDVLYAAADTTEVYVQPQRDNRQWIAGFLFLFYMVFFFMLMLNLSIGVIVDKFMDLKQAGMVNLYACPAQRRWLELKRNLFGRPLIFDLTNLHTLSWHRRKAYVFSADKRFENFILASIVANTGFLALMIFPAPTHWWDDMLRAADWVFTAIFSFEAIVKIYALRANYFKDPWYRFDFLCVISTDISIILRITPEADPVLAAALQVFRICRLFRLLRRLKSLNKTFTALVLALPKLVYTFLILLLLLTLYGILGVNLFATVKRSGALDEHGNFSNFFFALLTLFRASTGEAWNEIMHALAKDEADFFREGTWCSPSELFDTYEKYEVLRDKCLIDKPNSCVLPIFSTTILPKIYWATFFLTVCLLILNLMIAVILEGYKDGEESPECQVIDVCIEKWKKYDPDQTTWLHAMDAISFMKEVLWQSVPILVPELVGAPLTIPLDSTDSRVESIQEVVLFLESTLRLLRCGCLAKKNGTPRKTDFTMMRMRKVRVFDVWRVTPDGYVNFLAAAKQVLRFLIADGLRGEPSLEVLEGSEDYMDPKECQRMQRLEHRQCELFEDQPCSSFTEHVAAAKIQKAKRKFLKLGQKAARGVLKEHAHASEGGDATESGGAGGAASRCGGDEKAPDLDARRTVE